VTQAALGPPPSTISVSNDASMEPSVPEPTKQPISLPETMTAVSQSTPPTPSLQNVSADMARTLNAAIVANYTATTNVEHPLCSETLEDMQWTVSGTDTLTPQALDLTNTYINQSKFPEGVSPLTKLYREPSPVSLDAPWTEQELERLSSLNLHHTVTPPPTFQHLLCNPDGEMEPDTLMGHIGQVHVQDEDLFMQPPDHNPTPPVLRSPFQHSPRRSVEPITHNEDHVMEDDTVPSKNQEKGGLELSLKTATGGALSDPPSPSQQKPSQSRTSLLIKSKTIVMSSSDEDEGESEQSSPPASPVHKKRAPTKSTSHPQTNDIPGSVASLRRSLGANFGSKPTLHGSLGSHVRGPTTMVTEPPAPVSEYVFSSCKPRMFTALPVQMVEEPFSFQYFSLDPDSGPKTYNFYTHQKVVRQLAFSLCNI
jgi:hypothetical protein